MSAKKEPTLLEDLNQALAAETLATFRYLYLSKMASGIDSLPLAKMFEEMSDGEWEHASLFMERIIQLGGIPISKPTEWEKRSFHPYTEPPRRGNDLKAMIRDSLKLERSAVDFYQRLASKTKDTDLITYKLAIDAMAEEANEAQKLQALLE
ncbi:MAG TPA: ferritin-like domain-containing protein [Candidatus Bathyarchaeia archaeon]|nr:ferritin-like domain-containing protein [Candidatus Bathyarchaeia archaeon]